MEMSVCFPRKPKSLQYLRYFAHNMVPGAAFNVGEEDSGKLGREAERAQGTVTTGLEVRAEGRMCGSSMLAFNLLLLSVE